MKALLNEVQLKSLAQTISEVEKHTSGELRLMIVSKSTYTGHVLPMLWLLMMVICWPLLVSQAHWVELRISVIVPMVVISFSLAWLLAKWEWLARYMIPTRDLVAQVWERAELEFHRENMGHTEGQTGILLFVSLFEHQAVVLGDKAIAQKLKAEDWESVIETMLKGPKLGWYDALKAAIQASGALLSQHFPAQPGNRNELPNHVIVKE